MALFVYLDKKDFNDVTCVSIVGKNLIPINKKDRLILEEQATSKNKIIATNKKYIEDSELGLKQIASKYDLKFAYNEELT